MRYVPYEELGDTTNIIVDGAAAAHTLLTLSHWPKSGTPTELKDDLSTQIVFRYLDRPKFWVSAEAVSNNHFDEDGLISIYALLHPEEAQARKAFLVDVAAAGDFGTYRFREAARTAFVLSAFADPDLSPLDGQVFRAPYPQLAASLYRELLPRLPEIIAEPERFRPFWEAEDALLDEGEALVRAGKIHIDEIESLDLAIVTLPETLADKKVHRFTQNLRAACHPMALNNALRSFRVLLRQGRSYELQYRYESYVQYVSRRPLPRLDLAPLAAQLSEAEAGNGHWAFSGVSDLIPKLTLSEATESRIPPAEFLDRVTRFLATATASWDPYD